MSHRVKDINYVESQLDEKRHRKHRSRLTPDNVLMTIFMVLLLTLVVVVVRQKNYFQNLDSVAVTSENLVQPDDTLFTKPNPNPLSSDPDERLAADVQRVHEVQAEDETSLTSKNSEFDAAKEFKAIVALSPVIMFTWDDPATMAPTSLEQTESTEPDSALSLRFKSIVSSYSIVPPPTQVSLSRHPHARELGEYINSVGNGLGLKHVLPGLVIAGRPCAGAVAVERLHTSGKLFDYIKSWGSGVVTIER
ncbi:unnamed protein product [Kuraishia capsulata CBS 1993]|uniref:Glutaredoxin domain-containing protein n=1 Tax=Kuraishia capsulata CBS 1993 TaxID=1382522 RepID=W6MVM8_9ASCO|nr:uncharacterized protein KUCA_T00005997001 [Kuraishia capsulata CBS 1993]CDK30002.1 unnamed protein product [Kuraishia capsulata CBS 1993]